MIHFNMIYWKRRLNKETKNKQHSKFENKIKSESNLFDRTISQNKSNGQASECMKIESK